MSDASVGAGETIIDEFDGAALERLIRFGGFKLLTAMVDMFRIHSPQRLEAARVAVERGDADGAKLAFHSLKSSAGQLGAVHLARLCNDAEELARLERLHDLSRVLASVQDAYDRAVQWMNRHVTESEPTPPT